jgi:hypothetical protein
LPDADQAAAALLSDEEDLPESDLEPLSLLLVSELLLSELEEEDSLFSLASRARRLVP